MTGTWVEGGETWNFTPTRTSTSTTGVMTPSFVSNWATGLMARNK